MKFSIVIPSYRRADLLSLCLRSLEQFAPENCEIIVVDDCSAEGIISKTAADFSFVKILRLETQSGFCLASNAGILAAQGEFVELLNDDTEVTPGWAEAALLAFENPEVGAVAPLVLQTGTAYLIDSAGDEYHSGGFARKRFHNCMLEDIPLEPKFVFGASGSSAFYRKAALEKAGLFPTEFGAYFEDVDLAHRLNNLGFRTWFEPSSIVWHAVSASHGRKPSREVLALQSLNEERVFWRNIDSRHIPTHLAVLGLKAIRRAREGNLIPFCKGRLRAFRELPELLSHKRRFARVG